MASVKSSASAQKGNADNNIVKQITRTAVIIFCHALSNGDFPFKSDQLKLYQKTTLHRALGRIIAQTQRKVDQFQQNKLLVRLAFPNT
jgi:hypothetical protein